MRQITTDVFFTAQKEKKTRFICNYIHVMRFFNISHGTQGLKHDEKSPFIRFKFFLKGGEIFFRIKSPEYSCFQGRTKQHKLSCVISCFSISSSVFEFHIQITSFIYFLHALHTCFVCHGAYRDLSRNMTSFKPLKCGSPVRTFASSLFAVAYIIESPRPHFFSCFIFAESRAIFSLTSQ